MSISLVVVADKYGVVSVTHEDGSIVAVEFDLDENNPLPELNQLTLGSSEVGIKIS